jgi:hypothetical protein
LFSLKLFQLSFILALTIWSEGTEMKHKILLCCLFFAGSSFAQVNLEDGLLAHYPFNGNVDDASVNGNHGSVHGAVLTSDRFGAENSAYDFDGYTTYISIPNSASLMSPTTSISLVAWVLINDLSHVGSNFGPVLMKSNSASYNFQYRMSVGYASVGIAFNNWDNRAYGLAPLSFGEWHLLIATVDSGMASFYLDGVFLNTDTINMPINENSLPLEIGRDVPGAIEVFDGKIDDIRIYDRVVNADEIEALLMEGLLPRPENLLITATTDSVFLAWDPVLEATSYRVFSAAIPYGIATEDMTGSFQGTSWNKPISAQMEFYFVKAITE